jgi:hypothetical protein
LWFISLTKFDVYWILAALVLLLTLAVPRLRPAGVVGCVILAAMLIWGMVQRWNAAPPRQTVQQRGAPASPAAARVSIPPASIDLGELKLSGGGAPFELRGEITNESRDVQLRAFTLQIVRKDCHAAALDPSGCATLWQVRQWINVTVPPGQTRLFAVSIWAHSTVPRPRGTLKDEFAVVSAAGEPAPE